MANYRIVKEATAWWPVFWQEADEAAVGGTVERRIEMKFARLDVDAANAAFTLGDTEFVAAVARNWREITDADDKPVPFDPEWIARVVKIPNLALAIGKAFASFITAVPETRLGNFAPPAAGGPAAGETAAATTAIAAS